MSRDRVNAQRETLNTDKFTLGCPSRNLMRALIQPFQVSNMANVTAKEWEDRNPRKVKSTCKYVCIQSIDLFGSC